ncbi:MAG: protein kinase [Candidatus Obscuribacterales bacterium]|nr:protein kinase [Candidatus Obscuribacterales bacterium]
MTEKAQPSIVADRYEIIAPVGAGTLGRVYRAFDPFLKKEFALKLLDIDTASQKDLLRFQQEAKVVSRLNHDNIVRVYNFGLDESVGPYIVLEFLDGFSLQKMLIDEDFLSIQTLLPIALQICDAMSYAHEVGVVHRDLKPSNLIVMEDEPGVYRPVVVDFGIAKFSELYMTRRMLSDSTDGIGTGTPYYMSPEQCDGLKTDARSNIYSLGCVLFQCLSGQPPFRGETLFEVLEKHKNAPIPQLTVEIAEGEVQGEIQAIIHKAMAKDVDSRFQTMTEMKEALYTVWRLLEESLSVPVEGDGLGESREGLERKVPGKVFFAVIFLFCLIAGLFVIDMLAGQSGQKQKKTNIAIDLGAKPEIYNAPGKENYIDTPKEQLVPKDDGDVLATLLDKVMPANLERYRFSLVNVDNCDLEVAKAVESEAVYRTVFIQHSDLTDSGFEMMLNWPLHTINLRYTSLTDKGIAYLPKFMDLESLLLYWPGEQVRWASLTCLSQCPKLKSVVLCDRIIDDRVLSVLSRCKNLEEVIIEDTSLVSDKGLLSLVRLAKLKGVRLFRCRNVSQTGIRDFRARRPDVTIVLGKSPAASISR